MDSRIESFLKTSWTTCHRGGLTLSDVQRIVAGLGGRADRPANMLRSDPICRRPPPPLCNLLCLQPAAESAPPVPLPWPLCLLFPGPRIVFPEIFRGWVVPVIQLQCHCLGKTFLAVSVSSGCPHTDRGLQQQKVLSHSSQGWKPKVMMPAALVPSEGGLAPPLADSRLLHASSDGTCSVHLHVALALCVFMWSWLHASLRGPCSVRVCIVTPSSYKALSQWTRAPSRDLTLI